MIGLVTAGRGAAARVVRAKLGTGGTGVARAERMDVIKRPLTPPAAVCTRHTGQEDRPHVQFSVEY